MQKVNAGRNLERSVTTEVETLRLLAIQRRQASLSLFLKQKLPSKAQARQALQRSRREPLRAGNGMR
jgi:hypothetical protein